jgi:predicted  nucleic acid-binding Zn-ribbon protein
VTAAQLLLRYQVLADRERPLRESIDDLERRLESDPVVKEKEEVVTSARSQREEVAKRLRESDREREAHRSRLHTRERELMSGRIRNPTELMQMSDEFAHMKAAFAMEEEAELALMEEAEGADAQLRSAESELAAATREAAANEPALRTELADARTELAEVGREKTGVWDEVPARDQAVFQRIRVRPPITELIGTQCAACHVTITSSGLQALRKGDVLVQCDNCGRILVVA